MLLCCALLGLLLLISTPTSAADRTPLACPSGQTIFVEGRAPANEALLLYLGGRAVGGGIAGADGTYRLPLRAQERPGSYPVEVRLRSTRAILERYTCFVDVPIGSAEASPTPEAAELPTGSPQRGATPGQAPPGLSPTLARSPTASTNGTPTLTPTVTSTVTPTGPTATPTVTPTGPTATPTVTPTGPTATPTRTLAPGQSSPTPTPTVRTSTSSILIIDIVQIDPAFADSEEYVTIRNDGRQSVNLRGWRLLNASRPDGARGAITPFVFPDYVLLPDDTVAVYGQVGDDDLEVGDFFWDQTQTIWRTGDRAELRDAQNNLIQVFTVPSR